MISQLSHHASGKGFSSSGSLRLKPSPTLSPKRCVQTKVFKHSPWVPHWILSVIAPIYSSKTKHVSTVNTQILRLQDASNKWITNGKSRVLAWQLRMPGLPFFICLIASTGSFAQTTKGSSLPVPMSLQLFELNWDSHAQGLSEAKPNAEQRPRGVATRPSVLWLLNLAAPICVRSR